MARAVPGTCQVAIARAMSRSISVASFLLSAAAVDAPWSRDEPRASAEHENRSVSMAAISVGCISPIFLLSDGARRFDSLSLRTQTDGALPCAETDRSPEM